MLCERNRFFVTFTSGTSGEPKAVLHGQRYLTGQQLQAEHWLAPDPGELVWCTAAAGWSKSARNAFIAPWLRGAAALLHDVGQVGLSRPIPGGATIEISALDQRRVAATGAAILARTADLSRLAPVVADVGIPHHRAVARGDVALASRVVRVVSAYDDLSASLEHQGALERILRSTPHDYDPLVVGALVRHLERRGTVSAAEGALLRELASDRPGPT